MELKFNNLILIIFITIFIFYFLNNTFVSKENFLTYYVPFVGQNSKYLNKLNNFYDNNDYLKNYFKKKFNYNSIIIASYVEDKKFTSYFMSLYISKTKLYNIENTFYDNRLLLLEDLVNNKINIGITDIPTLSIFLNKYNENIDKIYAVSTLYKKYLICATKLNYQVYNINNIPYGFKIGIVRNNTIFYYYKKIINDLNLDVNDYKIKIYDNENELIKAFSINNEINMIMYFTNLPSKNINNMINYDFKKDIIILPFDIPQKLYNQFYLKNNFTSLEDYDLNKISDSYLPKKFGKYEYVIFRPNMKILTIDQIFLTNSTTDNIFIYNLGKFLIKYTKSLNMNLGNNQKMPQFGINLDLVNFINYHPKTLELLQDYGFITYENNNNCKYFVGKKKCDYETLKKNGFN